MSASAGIGIFSSGCNQNQKRQAGRSLRLRPTHLSLSSHFNHCLLPPSLTDNTPHSHACTRDASLADHIGLLMAAFDTPWISMSDPQPSDERHDGSRDRSLPEPTVAGFSPNKLTTTRNRPGASVLIHQKSPLLAATPPQVTRALAYSHPFILPLNHLAGLLSWTTGDAWESFLLVAAFWFTVLYGDDVLRWAGPVVVIVFLIAGMYSRRYSPLSSTTWSGEKKLRRRADSDSQQRKSLDEILNTLQMFTNRCDVLLDPFLRLTEFLSTQTTATSASTRPALTSMFIRLLAITPIWVLLTLPPLRIITTHRVLLVLGTLGMTWHSRPARASRVILWRSRAVRAIVSIITGLHFSKPTSATDDKKPPPLPPRTPAALASALRAKGNKPGVRFTFAIYENQRRWIMLGFTSNMFLHERQSWTDEHLNTVPEKDSFELPDTDNDYTKWRWVEGSTWRLDSTWTDDSQSAKGVPRDKDGWTYYDNKWCGGGRINDWNKWTRRRRWIRDAELIEATPEEIEAANAAGQLETPNLLDGEGTSTAVKKKGWFGKRRPTNEAKAKVDKSDAKSVAGSVDTNASKRSRDDPEDDVHSPMSYRETQWDRSIGDGLAEGLG
ncbi:unnamed protein product [Zymoseptoria tritici ST99CH_1A5]|nr:unnamed protein product [Zymoseptoria tritici ST99CH_1A5]